MTKKFLTRRIKYNKNKITWMLLMGVGLILVGTAVLLMTMQGSAENNSSSVSAYSTIPLEANYPAPEIELTDLSLYPADLKDYRNQIVLVNNWATWCPPCKAEMPTLETYYQAHANEGFTIIAIESGESITEVSDFVDEYAISFPVWIDLEGVALDAFSNWNLPSSYVIDRDGMIRLTWTGEISLEMLDKYVTPLLKE